MYVCSGTLVCYAPDRSVRDVEERLVGLLKSTLCCEDEVAAVTSLTPTNHHIK